MAILEQRENPIVGRTFPVRCLAHGDPNEVYCVRVPDWEPSWSTPILATLPFPQWTSFS